jgi:hypothetical protein
MAQTPASPFGNTQAQYASVGTNVAGAAGTGGYGTYHMNAGDFVYSLMPYMWSKIVPPLRARGLPFRHVLDVTDAVATTGATAKVTVAQNQTPSNLYDGNSKTLTTAPPLVSEVTITDDIYNSWSVTDFVTAVTNRQPTIPATIAGAVTGLLNAIEEQFITDIIYNVPSTNVVGTYNTALTSTTLSSAQSVLVQNYAPARDFYAMLAPSPNAWDSLIAIPTITWAQIRGAPASSTQDSIVVEAGESYGQNVRYLGGEWSQSQLVPYPTVTVVQCSNIMWDKDALAAIIRPPELPMPGIGVVARNFSDAAAGISLQMSFMYNKDSLAQEMVIRTLIGDAPAQPAWSVLIRS